MRVLLTFAAILLLPVAVLAQSENPLLRADPIPEELGAQSDIFEFVAEGIEIALPTGGYFMLPGDEGWDYSEATILDWNHDEDAIYSVQVLVDEYDSPITAREFDMLAGEYRDIFAEDIEVAQHTSDVIDLTGHSRPWKNFTIRLVYDDGYACDAYHLQTYQHHRLYSVVCYLEAAGDRPARATATAIQSAVGEILAGVIITPPAPLADWEFASHGVPAHGLVVELPTAGEIIPYGTPELAAMKSGPVEPSFFWSQADAPAHQITWFTFAKATEMTALEFEQFAAGIWEAVTDEVVTGELPMEVVEIGGHDWTWADAGITDPEAPETNTLLYLAAAPGAVHMVMAYANQGYTDPALEQLERILASVEFSAYSVAAPESELLELPDCGVALKLPGGGIFSYPGDWNWDYPEMEEVVFEWVHLDNPLGVCRLAIIDVGTEFTNLSYVFFGKTFLGAAGEEMGATAGEELPVQEIGDFTWHIYELEFRGEEDSNELVYVTHRGADLYVFYFDFVPEYRSIVIERAEQCLATFSLDT